MNEHLNIILGGYVGLFIGYTVAQVPSFLFDFATWIKSVLNTLKIFYSALIAKRQNQATRIV